MDIISFRHFRRILFIWLKRMRGKADAALLILGLCVYAFNRFLFKQLVRDIPVIGYFFKNYFNDLLGGFCFVAFLDFVLKNETEGGRAITKVYQAGLTGFFCGILWEYIFPLIYPKGTTDPADIVMYTAGSCIFALLRRSKPVQRIQDQREVKTHENI